MTSSAPRVRPPAVAGRFYDDEKAQCAADANRLCVVEAEPEGLPGRLLGAMVPHAGWVCSGRIAGAALSVVGARTSARTFLLAGSVHTMQIYGPALDAADAWRTPMGDVSIDRDLREAIGGIDGFETIDAAHAAEHSLEVQLPLMQAVFGSGIRFVPCLIPSEPHATTWGAAIGRLLTEWPEPVAVIASSDLTHYGPRYRFAPHGVGEEGARWAHQVNDATFLDRVCSMAADRVVAESRQNQNACGGGAVAVAMAACSAMGARRGYLLEHTNSARELRKIGHPDESNSVGYAGVVFG